MSWKGALVPVEIAYRFRNTEQLCLSKVKVMNTEKFTGQTQQTCRKRPTARAALRPRTQISLLSFPINDPFLLTFLQFYPHYYENR